MSFDFASVRIWSFSISAIAATALLILNSLICFVGGLANLLSVVSYRPGGCRVFFLSYPHDLSNETHLDQ